MGKEFGRGLEACVLPGGAGLAQLQRVPVDDDRGQQVGASDSAMLAFLGSVMQFAALLEIDGARQGMMRLVLVQAVMGAAELLPGSNCLNHTNRVTLASTVSFVQIVEFAAKPGRNPLGDAGFDPAFHFDQRVGAEPPDHRRGRQDCSHTTACIDEPAHQILVYVMAFQRWPTLRNQTTLWKQVICGC